MNDSNVIVDQAFRALEETARIVRGVSSEVAKDAKKKNAAYWHAMLFNAVSKNPSKLQAVRQRLEQWISGDMESCVPVMLGHVQSVDDAPPPPSPPPPPSSSDQKQQLQRDAEQQLADDVAAAFLVDGAAIQRICDSYAAYKQIAFAATVIFEAVGSSKTGTIDINKTMMKGYRDRIFKQVKGALFKFVAYHVTLCRRKEELLPSGGGLLRGACRMFATVAQQYETAEERMNFYDVNFVRPYHSLALQEARHDVAEFLRQPSALEGLLSWSEDRIAFEAKLVELFLHDKEAGDVNNPLAAKRFRRQLQSVFVVPRLDEVISHQCYGFAANLASGNWARLKQQFSWATAEKDRVPSAGDACVAALIDFVKSQVAGVVNSFNEQTFDSTAAAATFFITALMTLMTTVFTDLISGFADEGAAASLQRPVRKEISRILSHCTLKRKVGDKAKGTLHESADHFADLLCIFVDLVLRDAKLLPAGEDYPSFCRNQVCDLFSVLEDRDIFAEHYRLRLSKRLLQTTWEEDNERSVLEVMQRQVGKLFTHKFEGMIFDVQGAQSLQEGYNDSVAAGFGGASSSSSLSSSPPGASERTSFEPKVLTAAYWPQLKRDDDFVAPESLQQEIGAFERFYRKKFPTRQLRWQAERGSALLAVAFPKGTREVTCSIYQAAVMLAIDHNSSSSSNNNNNNNIMPTTDKDGVGFTIKALAAKTGIELRELKPLVASMLLAKGLNLIRTRGENPLNAKFGDNDAVEMNPGFVCKIRKIKLPSAITARSAASDSVGQNAIDASRAQMLDAAIVRVMKSRKEMRMTDLVDTVVNQVTKFFIPQPRDIKQRVEFLIQKEFLERDDDHNDIFRYLA